jgi:hypothetical protein
MFGHDDTQQTTDTNAAASAPTTDTFNAPPDLTLNSDSNEAPATTSPIMPPSTPADDSVPTSDDAAGALTLPSFTPSSAPAASPATETDDLSKIKQDALQDLTPLVKHLEQTPEEKFRTTMMMIQATDDQSLIQSAYDAAKQISDEKVRAQALLDIVNEINYFTQHKS